MHPTPWHFWPIVAIAVLWHLVGCVDYTATQMEWRSWMQMVSRREARYIDAMPEWIDAIWAISVWTGLLGAVMMAARARVAPLVLFASFAALSALAIWAALLAAPAAAELAGPVGLAILVGSAVLGLLFWLYARAMNARGIIG